MIMFACVMVGAVCVLCLIFVSEVRVARSTTRKEP
jgi:hypothetical protein